MNEARWISRIRLVLFILAVIAIALVITHMDEIGTWLTEALADSRESQIERILE